MGAETMLNQADTLIFEITGKHLNDLQRRILEQAWQRQTYGEMARRLRYTEGHIKDVASQLWQTLSQSLDEPVTKGNCRSVLERRLADGNTLAPAPPRPSAPAPIAFLGREGAIADLQDLIHQGHRTLVLKGEGGIGKTTLAQQFLEQAGFDQVLELLMAKETINITPAEQVVEEWLRQDFQIEPGRDFGVTLDRLKRQLRTRRVGILIDNLEPALDSQGRFWPQQSRYGDVLRVLCDPKGQAVTLLTSRDRLCEPSITVTHYRLPGLGVETWHAFFAQTAIDISAATLAAMHRAYGGNAKAMTILRGAIQGDFDGEGDAYWQENGTDPLVALDLKNLVASQVNRLKDLDPEAYGLFCRLGAYRYQDVPRLPTDGVLALMWDVDPARHRQVIMSLRNRSLLESHRGHYWLHPVVQAEALSRLHPTPDWSIAQDQAAQFWTASVTTLTTVADATHALEAYYHRWAIADYPGAAAVLLHSYHNQWGQYLTLGSALYRIGLLQPLRTAITALLPHLPKDQRASELRNILADVYWISGQVHGAIALQEEARAIALHCLETLPETERQSHPAYCLTMVQVDALLSLGLYHLDLWDLGAALEIFQQVRDTATGTAHQSWADKATLCWALVQSYSSRQLH
ncbi:MAG: ATP-binding protein [Cyanobacteria bacterium]|nr:ATP-binding protein [Cyanobacteriota bacterium]